MDKTEPIWTGTYRQPRSHNDCRIIVLPAAFVATRHKACCKCVTVVQTGLLSSFFKYPDLACNTAAFYCARRWCFPCKWLGLRVARNAMAIDTMDRR